MKGAPTEEARVAQRMQIDDNDALFSEWSANWKPVETFHASPSLSPYEISFDPEEDEDPYPVVSPEHRRKLQRYVQATMAGCVLLGLAAVVRVSIAKSMADAEPSVASSASEGAAVASVGAAPEPPQPMTSAIPAAAVPVVSPPVTAKAAPAPEPLPAPATAPSAPASAANQVRAVSNAPEVSPATSAAPRAAAQEREAARRALEHGRLRDAVAAAARATAGDPTDAEAWLILGAANQELGHASAARDAFATCARQAKHGPVGECSAMLR